MNDLKGLEGKGLVTLEKNNKVKYLKTGEDDLLFSHVIIYQYDDVKKALEEQAKEIVEKLYNTNPEEKFDEYVEVVESFGLKFNELNFNQEGVENEM